MQNLYIILITFQRIPLNFDDKEGLWFLKRELPVSEPVKAGLLLLISLKFGLILMNDQITYLITSSN